MSEPDRSRAISANDMHVIMTQCLDAARYIHIAMCRFSDDHAAQEYLNNAMHAALVGAEQCRQLHKSAKYRFASDGEASDSPAVRTSND